MNYRKGPIGAWKAIMYVPALARAFNWCTPRPTRRSEGRADPHFPVFLHLYHSPLLSYTFLYTFATTPKLQAPRISYLPLLLPQIQKYFLDLILDDPSVSAAAGLKIEDLWFSYQGVPLKWHWPIGLLYDYHTSHSSPSPSSNTLPTSLASVFAPSRSPSPSTSTSDQRTLRSSTSPYSARASGGPPLPWKITLHLKAPPNEVLLMGSSVEGCRSAFMNMVKEADYVRWGSVKRVTNLRKEQQDGLWEGVVANDFDRFHPIFSKLVPLPSASSSSPSTSRSPTPLLPTGSSIPTDGRLPDANAVRSVPMRIYLPEGAPVLQEVVVPVVDGHPQTLQTYLRSSLPLFFPPSSAPLAIPIIHGIEVPLETELGWLGAGMCGADGWVGVVLRLG